MASVLRAAITRVASSFASAALPATNCSTQPKLCLNTARLFSTCLLHCPVLPSSSTHVSSRLAQPAFKAPILSLASRLSPAPVTFTPSRCYHMRLAVRRRCASCFFVRRKGRLYVECKAKPRHKQMQMMSKRKIWRDDYSKGNVDRAVWWKYNEEKQYYKLGDNQWARYDWLKGRIGVNV